MIRWTLRRDPRVLSRPLFCPTRNFMRRTPLIRQQLKRPGKASCAPARVERRRSEAWLLATVLSIALPLGAAWLPAFDAGADERDAPRILVLHSLRRELPVIEHWQRGIRDGLEASFGGPMALDSEYLDFDRLDKQADRQALLNLVLSKYESIPPDVVIPVHDSIAALFARQNPFPNASIVYCSIHEKSLALLPRLPRATGVVYRFAPRRTLHGARRLFPTTRGAVVISGSAEVDLRLLETLRAELDFERSFPIEYWTGLPLDELQAKVAQLPRDRIILFNSYLRHSAGEIATVPRDVLEQIVSISPVPVFGLYDTLLGTGILGGCMAPVEDQGRLAGELAARILLGESAESIPFSGAEMNRFIFDARAMRAWGLRERDLPSGSVVEFASPSLWTEYRPQLIGGLSVVALQSALIATLLVQRRRRRRAEQELERQLRFEALLASLSSRIAQITSNGGVDPLADALDAVVMQLPADGGALYDSSDSRDEFRPLVWTPRGDSADERRFGPLRADGWLWGQLSAGRELTFRAATDWPSEANADEAWRTGLDAASALLIPLAATDSVSGILVFVRRDPRHPWDSSTRQQLKLVAEFFSNALARTRVESALSETRRHADLLAGRILTAQEDERKRIARELHDDISQRLAASAIEAGKAEQSAATEPAMRSAFGDLRNRLIALSDDVHRLSRQLHPSILDDLGLKDALRAECDRVASRGGIAVRFGCGSLPDSLPKQAALCVYRVAQEALNNAVKHSGSTRIELTVSADLEFLDLEVRDFGCGFEPGAVRSRAGLGLASMEERVRLAGGEIAIDSAAGQGTRLQARVPLAVED